MTTKRKLDSEKAPALPAEGAEDNRDDLEEQPAADVKKRSAAQNIAENADNKKAMGKGKAAEDAKLNDDPQGRTAEEETADRQADSFADSATTFTKSYLVQADYFDEDTYDHGPNKQNLIQEAINNGLRILGLPADAQNAPGQEGAEDLEPNEYHNIGLVDADDVVQFVGAELYDFGIPGREKLSYQLTYAAEAIPAHLVGAGPTEALTDQRGTVREVVSPRHVGSTGSQT